jgi:hypothetical protein
MHDEDAALDLERHVTRREAEAAPLAMSDAPPSRVPSPARGGPPGAGPARRAGVASSNSWPELVGRGAPSANRRIVWMSSVRRSRGGSGLRSGTAASRPGISQPPARRDASDRHRRHRRDDCVSRADRAVAPPDPQVPGARDANAQRRAGNALLVDRTRTSSPSSRPAKGRAALSGRSPTTSPRAPARLEGSPGATSSTCAASQLRSGPTSRKCHR